MNFGDYLLSKNIISEDQLLDAITYQLEHMPSFLRVLRNEEILSSREILQLIRMQFDSDDGFVGILKSEKKIEKKMLQALYKKQTEGRNMLGGVLVELKFVEQSVVEKMLYEFLGNKENLKTTSKPVLAGSEIKKAVEIEVSEAALESLRELGLSTE